MNYTITRAIIDTVIVTVLIFVSFLINLHGDDMQWEEGTSIIVGAWLIIITMIWLYYYSQNNDGDNTKEEYY